MAGYPVHRRAWPRVGGRSLFTVTARLAHVIRYITPAPRRRHGTADVTIVFDEDLTGEQYADRGNGIWAVLKSRTRMAGSASKRRRYPGADLNDWWTGTAASARQ